MTSDLFMIQFIQINDHLLELRTRNTGAAGVCRMQKLVEIFFIEWRFARMLLECPRKCGIFYSSIFCEANIATRCQKSAFRQHSSSKYYFRKTRRKYFKAALSECWSWCADNKLLEPHTLNWIEPFNANNKGSIESGSLEIPIVVQS